MSAPGSSDLTPEQTDFYVGRFGERYLSVQENHLRPSRRLRRRQRRKISAADIDVHHAQEEARRRLLGQQIRPV